VLGGARVLASAYSAHDCDDCGLSRLCLPPLTTVDLLSTPARRSGGNRVVHSTLDLPDCAEPVTFGQPLTHDTESASMRWTYGAEGTQEWPCAETFPALPIPLPRSC
jgi:hypothetical protein